MSACNVNRAGLGSVELEDGISRGNREDSTEERMVAISEARRGHVSRVVGLMEWRVDGIWCRSR